MSSAKTEEWPCALKNAELPQTLKNARVLCVGAGGIGCELLKTLVVSGFENIQVIDLDTIETSNLNRQFLFRRQHVGQSKAATAANVIKGIKSNASITAHHANVKEAQFGVDFIKGFSIILNGLDNLEARRHVNRLAMAAEVPLVESGTAGYLGQVTVHLKNRTECFECTPKTAPKTYPICTLRNTPDKPIHCVVWAKDLLFSRLFGRSDEVTDLDDPAAEGGPGEQQEGQQSTSNGAEGNGVTQQKDQNTNQKNEEEGRKRKEEEATFFVRREAESPLEYAVRVFQRAYTHDIERLAAVKTMWTKRAPPKPLHLSQLLPEGPAAAIQPVGQAEVTPTSVCKCLGLGNPNEKWSPRDAARVFLASVCAYYEKRSAEVGSLTFDKDDDLAVEFVTAASALRSFNYDIPTQSLFDAKGMAGNIIHAIATTNAIISGLIVIEAIKILAGAPSALRSTYLNEQPSSKRLLGPNKPEPPKPECLACGTATLTLRANAHTLTLGALVSQVLKRHLAVNVPFLTCGDFMYEEGEGLEEDEVETYRALLPRAISKLPGGGLQGGSILNVSDESQHLKFDMIIQHQEDLPEEEAPEGFILEGSAPKPQELQQQNHAAAEEDGVQEKQQVDQRKTHAHKVDASGAVDLISDGEEEVARRQRGSKRGVASGDGEGPSKRARMDQTEEAIVLD
uniref:SUMO-activating enzyme subunit n=1 Tax=Dunaliella tertiolecta TaxID=3047 RepID=A0A7S3RAN3_DUNTE|mmetsp:Transcript_4486/g.12223  ORF Transcript_4486/g.12223 Transcript_4486/m.12223 type:complete len:681 (-) Transcript_4486:117-2159(-)